MQDDTRMPLRSLEPKFHGTEEMSLGFLIDRKTQHHQRDPVKRSLWILEPHPNYLYTKHDIARVVSNLAWKLWKTNGVGGGGA